MDYKYILKQVGKETVTLPFYEKSRNTIVSGMAFGGSCLIGNIPLIITTAPIFIYNLEKSIKLHFMPLTQSATHLSKKVNSTWLQREIRYQKVRVNHWMEGRE